MGKGGRSKRPRKNDAFFIFLTKAYRRWGKGNIKGV